MARTTICLILGALLMLQLAEARYGPRGFVLRNMFEEGITEKFPFKNIDAQNAFVTEKMKEITGILEETVTASADVFKKVIKEANASQNQSPEFRALIANMTQYTQSVERLLLAPNQAQKTWVFEEFEALNHLMDRYNFNEATHPSEEEKYFKRLLDNNDYESLKLMFGLKCFEFVQSFDDAVADYITSLSPEQKQLESNLISKFQRTTADKDYNKMEWLEHVFSRFNVKVPKGNY